MQKLLSLKHITRDDLKHFSESEQKQLGIMFTDKFNNLNGVERDKFLEKVDGIIEQSTRNEIWENNHSQITCAISNLIQDYGRMPSKGEIATKAGLSRQTVHKHLKDYSQHPLFGQQVEQYKFMASKVLAKVFQFAVKGDISAAKLYFNIIGNSDAGLCPASNLIKQQNNFIQINKTVLSQESIKNLTPHQLDTIENMLKNSLEQSEIDYTQLSTQTLKEISELKAPTT